MTRYDIVAFSRVWSRFATGIGDTMLVAKLPRLLNSLDQSSNLWCEECRLTGLEMERFIDRLNIPADVNRVHYADVLYRLAQYAFERRFPGEFKQIDELPHDHETVKCLR